MAQQAWMLSRSSRGLSSCGATAVDALTWFQVTVLSCHVTVTCTESPQGAVLLIIIARPPPVAQQVHLPLDSADSLC